MKNLIAGNWKMNGTESLARAVTAGILEGLAADEGISEKSDLLVCPPALHIAAVRHEVKGRNLPLHIGAQDCSENDDGAYTGDLSAAMLQDAGAGFVILGHSERRQYHNESNSLIASKSRKAHAHNLTAIICVGETEDEREQGRAQDVVSTQLAAALPETAESSNTVIAYEPVWAIGTGRTATPDDIGLMHEFIRQTLQEKLEDSENMRILYGGSVKPQNANEIFAVNNVNGALVGGASLEAGSFLAIAAAC